MGENLAAPGRLAVRTPMQWSPDDGAGFSRADPSLFPALLCEGRYGPLAVNVADQRRDPDSLLNWFERLMRRRREVPELGLGTLRVMRNDADAVLSHRCDWDGSTVVAVHNLAAEPCRVSVPIDGLDDVIGCDDLLGRDRQELSEPVLHLTIEGYGYRWFRILRAGQRTPP